MAGVPTSYTYDGNGNGNRLTKIRNGVTESYSYDDSDKLLSVAWTGGSKTYGYDAAGRTTSITSSAGTTTLAYDFESRVTTLSGPGISQTNTYNGLDTRVSKIENGVSQTFVRDGAYVTDPVLRDSSAAYTPGISERRGSVSTFQHSGIKNAASQSTAGGSLSAFRVYDAFGNLESGGFGAWQGPFGYAGSFGYQEDGSGLRLLGHRFYDSSTGRFLTRDKAKDGRNWYAYAAGQPIGYADPRGLWIETAIDVASLAMSIYDFAVDPSWENAGWVAADVAGVILPIPSPGIIKHVGKGLGKGVPEVAQAVGKLDDVGPRPKPGASGGDSAGERFTSSTKREAHEENKAANGGKTVCVYCRMETDSPHVDHAIPRSLGGNATLDNAQITCPHCNLSKGNRGAPVTPPSHYGGPWPAPWW